MSWYPGSVMVEIANDADAQGHSARDGLGHGIIGMRERAALVGGSLDIDHADGRFRVRARIPWEGTE
jgi:signal transduction histidine kinase